MIQLQIFKESDVNVLTKAMNDFLGRPDVLPLEIRVTEDACVGIIIYQDGNIPLGSKPPPLRREDEGFWQGPPKFGY